MNPAAAPRSFLAEGNGKPNGRPGGFVILRGHANRVRFTAVFPPRG